MRTTQVDLISIQPNLAMNAFCLMLKRRRRGASRHPDSLVSLPKGARAPTSDGRLCCGERIFLSGVVYVEHQRNTSTSASLGDVRPEM